ncbi:hypothetical protein N7476_004949 [Penicillium atrosanguineum]|uniref:Nephrocystin 3-like N-terminal domain-containing protein n=1 Tax=Penicillium atrosanguineum TaxID=1132637 RepID=A0A9W9PYI1_9EURO|nr:hypothetical protein N7526_001941 [Penicillium atrosanguineum]KAJ5318529.1 hypothetical protein N7476_004949 [Penicillium atrosanguineum]
MSIRNLASTYRKQGRWKEAEQLEVQVMETSKTKLGEDHPDTLTIMTLRRGSGYGSWEVGRCDGGRHKHFLIKRKAGTGKSRISRTVAKDTNHLGASFFFKRGEGDRGNAKKFFPTLRRQLMLRISGLRSGVQEALRHDPDIASKSLNEQFEKLLLQPLLNLNQLGRQPQTTVIVIDALDECEHGQDIRTIIRLLLLLQQAKTVRLRIFLTSRPELPISLGFSRDRESHISEATEHDIHSFLQYRFVKIIRDRNISDDWPADNVIQDLVMMSIPLFIAAATLCLYIEN